MSTVQSPRKSSVSSFVGLKVSHDGAVCLIEGDTLRWCVEAEKHNNGRRYSTLSTVDLLTAILDTECLQLADLGGIALDGWFEASSPDAATFGHHGAERVINVGPYSEDPSASAMSPIRGWLDLNGSRYPYASYSHVIGHVLASYCSSSLAVRHEQADVVVWDGSSCPTLFHVDPNSQWPTEVKTLLPISGALYPLFASTLSQFSMPAEESLRLSQVGELSHRFLPVSGKAMAYAGLGQCLPELYGVFDTATTTVEPSSNRSCWRWCRIVDRELRTMRNDLTDPQIFASFQRWLGDRLIRAMHDAGVGGNLCLGGGCFLNITWNAAIRDEWPAAWIPPFANDSGNAIGAACALRLAAEGKYALTWDVYSGPRLGPSPDSMKGWTSRPAGVSDVADCLVGGEPVMVLNGRAELGPRALGNRSILAPATDVTMKDRLNEIKRREWYRPVAPICLPAFVGAVFETSERDDYMLFESRVRSSWKSVIPAVVHVDGTARVQTLDRTDVISSEILVAYHALTGIPVLCNTSANHSGCGFFPDVASALEWGRVDRVFDGSTLWTSET